jgi:hypothetical protein
MSLATRLDYGAPGSATSPDGSAAFPLNSAATPLPTGATTLAGSSGVVSASAAVATLTSAAGRLAYITGFSVSGLGATTAIVAAITITGLAAGTLNFGYPVPAGVGVAGPPMSVSFPSPLPASAVATNIVVTVASFGAGNTGAVAMAQGYMI